LFIAAGDRLSAVRGVAPPGAVARQRIAWNRNHATGRNALVAQIGFVWSDSGQTRHSKDDVHPVRPTRPASIVRKPAIAKTEIENFVPDLTVDIGPSL